MKRVQPTHVIQPQQHTIMRRVIQPRDNTQSTIQMNAVNKVNNLSNVSVTSTSHHIQPRVRQTIYASQVQSGLKCFICDENIMGAPTVLKDSETQTSHEKVAKKLARLMGDDFCVIVSEEDVICRRCLTLFNTMDKYEFDLENVRTRLKGFINKKYSIEDEEPPAKIQRLNESQSNRWQNTSATTAHKEAAENQLKHLSTSPVKRAGPVKLYKCIACDFKTTDLNAFQPHSSVCKGQTKTNQNASPAQNRPGVNRMSYTSPSAGGIQQRQTTTLASNTHQVGRTTIVRNNASGVTTTTSVTGSTSLACPHCPFKTSDRNAFNDHQRNHMKLRPFKCRMCLERFATREAAQVHAKIHSNNNLKCGICNRQFLKRDIFDVHMKTHENERFKSVQQQEVIIMSSKGEQGNATTQKPLTDIIKEALSEEDQDGVNEFIEFHSCNLCSLTFVNKKLYAQHMKTHESPVKAEPQVSFIKGGKSQDTMGDLESIFEKMHSESGHHVASNGSLSDSKNVLITTQESGGITYNITIPQDDIPQDDKPVRIDMPSLTDNDEDKSVPVSMPSLHDDENTQSSQEQQTEVQQIESEAIPMDLEELQQAAAAEGQQLKFIVDENGQFLQLDNHILTTDADGNQILVQGTDQEQLQHLLQSVGVDGNQVLVQLQDNGEGMDGETATLQFGEGAQGQMILVQNENGESQLIDASMLQTEGGNLVLQQGADGETTLTTADGIPVSVSFSGEGADGQITLSMAGTGEDGQPIFIQQPVEVEGETESAKTESGEVAMQLEESSQESSTAATEAAPTSSENAEPPAEEKTASTEPEPAEETTEETKDENDSNVDSKKEESSSEEKEPADEKTATEEK